MSEHRSHCRLSADRTFGLKVFFEAREPGFLVAAAVEGRPLEGMC